MKARTQKPATTRARASRPAGPGRLLAITSSMPRTVLVGVAAGVTVLAGSLLAAGSGSAATARQGLTHYQEILRSQVQQPDGTPRDGRDPAQQKQTGLLAAAGRPQGPGLRGNRPAAGVQPRVEHRQPSAVLDDPKQTGVLSNGCAADYGRGGQQCLPARAPGDKPLTCAYVVTLFPDGVIVAGRDRFGLDTNGDGLACGAGDRGAPAGHLHEH